MAQHKCGTCRYFEEGGFAGSGRCSHPLRKNLEQMVLVRKSELACRSDWANDLWEPVPDTEPVHISSNPRFTSEAGKSDDRRQYTDRVTAVGVAPSRNLTTEGHVTVTRSERRATTPEMRAEATFEPVTSPDEPSMPDEPAEVRKTRAASSGPDEERDTRSYEELRRDLLKPRPGAESASRPSSSFSRPNPDRSDPMVPSGPGTSPQAAGRDMNRPAEPATRAERHDPRPSETDPRSRMPAESASSPRPREEREPQFGAPLPRKPEPPSEPQARSFGAFPATTPSTDSLPKGRSGWTEPFDLPSSPQSPVAEPVEEVASMPVEEPPAETRPHLPVVQPQVKQTTLKECCGTCRDFRPAEGGDRGWCNNPYAFDHRRMVEKNELACRSTIGTWWIASDDWWLQRADVTHHGRPTPIVDEMLRQLLNSRPAMRRAGRG